jgi:hypothetical protein
MSYHFQLILLTLMVFFVVTFLFGDWIKCEEYWLPIPFASFTFTSPPVRHRVPSHSNRTDSTQVEKG